jgi:hypothetical protein
VSAWKSNRAAGERALRNAVDAGLIAAAAWYTNGVRARLVRGYTSGAFSHGMEGVAGRVMRTEPYATASGRAITMGTSKVAGYSYELAWELGHTNAFTRQYERVEVWRPMLVDNADRILTIAGRAARAHLDGAAGRAMPEAAD